MSRDKQMINDLIEIFDEEYGKRNLITPHNTADKLTAKGYRKASDVAEEIFAEIEDALDRCAKDNGAMIIWAIAELKKKYIGEGRDKLAEFSKYSPLSWKYTESENNNE